MPLKNYVQETVEFLNANPEANEVVVERAKPMRFAERDDYDAFNARYNEGWLTMQAYESKKSLPQQFWLCIRARL